MKYGLLKKKKKSMIKLYTINLNYELFYCKFQYNSIFSIQNYYYFIIKTN